MQAKSNRIALIRPDNVRETFDVELQEPLGIETLASYLRSHGFEVSLFDPRLQQESEQDIAVSVSTGGYLLAGFSIMSGNDIRSALKIVQTLGANGRPCLVVGGSLPTTEPDAVLRAFPPGTVCVRGEGELTLLTVARALQEGREPVGIPSTAAMLAGGTVEWNAAHTEAVDVGTLPFADRSLCGPVLRAGQALNLQGSRGCCGRCRYCNQANPEHQPVAWRGRPPRHIVDEIESLYRDLGVCFFNFVDDDFLGPHPGRRAQEFRDELRARGMSVAFGIQARPQALSVDILQVLSEAGLCYAFVGLENDDAGALKRWNRPDYANHVLQLARNAVLLGIDFQVGAIPFHRFATVSAIRSFAARLCDNGLLNYRTATNRMVLLPGSPLHTEYAKDHPGETLSGAMLEGFEDPAVERLYQMVSIALSPLYPVWLHTACLAPRMAAHRRLGSQSTSFLGIFQNIRTELDAQVTHTLFRCIDEAENGSGEQSPSAHMIKRSAAVAESCVRSLLKLGLIDTTEPLLAWTRRSTAGAAP